MEWLNTPVPYENMGDCDFYVCDDKVYPCPVDGFCAYNLCAVDIWGCIIKIGK